jgi:hypothetical protein
MPNINIIMGQGDSRKSSTIRALTGAFQRGCYDIATNENIIKVYVQIRALQEAEIESKDFISDINSKKFINVILSLRIESLIINGREFLDGKTYIRDFINANWDIRNIFVLGRKKLPYDLPSQCPVPKFFPKSETTPANKIASDIRGILNWL